MAVSVLMPMYNAASTVGKTVATIQDQSFTDWELVAVDDGSQDNTCELLQDMADGDARIRLIRRPHQGIVGALNHGLAICRHPLIARMDADDLCAPERLALQVAGLQQNPDLGLISSQVAYGGDTEAFQGFSLFVDWTNELLSPEAIAVNRFVETPLVHPTVLFRRELVDLYGGYRDGDFPEDYELWLRWLDAGVRMAKLPQVLLTWCERAQRLTRTDPRYAVDAFYRVKAQYLARHLLRQAHKDVVIWGAGRISRKRAELLTEHGIGIRAYVDIDPKKIGCLIHHRPVWSKEQLPEPGACFLLAYVGSRGARALIEQYLQHRGYQPGRDYLLAA